MRRLLIFLLCSASCVMGYAQSLKGKILAADTKKPVAFANVFLANTSIGTTTKEDGEFVISNFPAGRYDLVVSYIGYESYTLSVQSNRLPENLEIILKPKVNVLQEVVLEPYEKDGWQKWGQFFLANFIGTSAFAEDCKLLNKDVLKFRHNKKTNVLRVDADDRLEIENKALGYHLKYDLMRFEYNFSTGIFIYQGYPLFEEMTTTRDRQRKKWLANREDAYNGSMMHFMRSLYRNKLIEQDFEVRKLIKIPEEEKKRVKTLYQARLRSKMSDGTITVDNSLFDGMNPDSVTYYKKVMQSPESMNVLIDKIIPGDSLGYAYDSTIAGFEFTDWLQITYTKKNAPAEYYESIRLPYKPGPMVSELFRTSNAPILVWSNGSYYEGTNLISSAYWGWSEKISSLLPIDYWPPHKK